MPNEMCVYTEMLVRWEEMVQDVAMIGQADGRSRHCPHNKVLNHQLLAKSIGRFVCSSLLPSTVYTTHSTYEAILLATYALRALSQVPTLFPIFKEPGLQILVLSHIQRLLP